MRTTILDSIRGFPVCIKPERNGESLTEVVRERHTWLASQVAEHGAVLLRGFDITSPDEFATAVAATEGQMLNYVHGNSPRSKVSGANVYTSTEYPAAYPISLHNELSYANRWPQLLFFHCVTAPQSGGQTPIADSREILRRIPTPIRKRFTEKGVLYQQRLRFGSGLGRSWIDTYETEDQSLVEKHLHDFGVDFEWTADGALRTRQLRHATVVHPGLDEEVWFNQADQWHWSGAGPGIGEELLKMLGEDDLPSSCRYGDGTAIDPDDLEEIRRAGWDSAATFDWVAGDMLIIDNVRMAHGRTPYSGPRRILVAMT